MKNMTRWMAGLLAAGLVLTGLVGCGEKVDDKTTEAAEEGLTELPDYSWEGIDLAKYVTLGTYEGITYTPTSTEVPEDEVESLIKELQQGSATSTQIKEGIVKDGDKVNIDYVGRIDGEEFQGGSAKGYTVVIGETQMIPGFIEGIVDQEIGSEVVLDLKFPDDYWSEDYAGKAVEFTITINYVAGESIVPEITDDWANTVTGGLCPTVDKLREYLRESLEEEAKDNAKNADEMAVWEQVTAGATVKELPEGALEYYYAEQKREIENMAMYYGVDYDTLVSSMGYTDETMEKQLATSAKTYCEAVMVARMLVVKIGKEVTEAEYQAKVESLAETYGYDDLEQLVEDYGGEIAIWDDMSVERAVAYVMEKAVAKEAAEK